MRICIDLSQAVYEGSGSGRYVMELVRELLRQDKENEYVLFGSAMRKRDVLKKIEQDLKGRYPSGKFDFKLYPFPPKLYEILWNTLAMVSIERFVGPIDIYHSSDWTEAPSSAKRVTTVHDLIPFLYPEYVHSRIREAHEKKWERIKKDVDSIIVDAAVTKKDIMERFSIADDKIVVIPLGCDSRFFSIGELVLGNGNLAEEINSKKVMSAYGLNAKSYLLAVGTLEPRKNIERLIQAYSQLEKSFKSKYPLVIVGKKAWAQELESSEGVIFTGYLEDSLLPYLYGNAYCFIMPSLYEGFGLPVLEAMACGVPVICSNRSSLPEIGGEDVHYIENPESVESIRLMLSHVLTSEPQELSLTAKNAYTRSRAFTWAKTAQRTLEVYKKLVKKD